MLFTTTILVSEIRTVPALRCQRSEPAGAIKRQRPAEQGSAVDAECARMMLQLICIAF